jgi:hypothetical protein
MLLNGKKALNGSMSIRPAQPIDSNEGISNVNAKETGNGCPSRTTMITKEGEDRMGSH